MSIKFHCEHCNKSVSAPDGAGGRMGRCPYCKQQCYVPLPPDQVEEIPLAPEDPEEDRRREQLRRETMRMDRELLRAYLTGPTSISNCSFCHPRG